ncbi:unnamed protein product (macronuclear) [Paramecium tetraurelia]|uniref:RING-type domain-containing protein n=1 Tax=Paramecium tetraurelia TaxID=5888 RepID=A0CA65_PARTE|nr:uncharacterized protein GSPATT00036462001 [Paramecium tetraurelia]CAK67682.1 unnamed protein product [Paramecium tetraurelia]|eukprot:XP_001435079.1 hypothetical protein (macronuclear) [Paramecium tetraurelia strain d4-2]
MISSEREYLNVKGQQYQAIHSKRFNSPGEGTLSISQMPSLPQLNLQAKQSLSKPLSKDFSSMSSIHLKPLICKNKSCIYLVRNLEDKILKCILRIKEIAKENNLLRKKLQMDQVIVDQLIPSTHRSQKSMDFNQLPDDQSQVIRSNIPSVHETYQFAKFHNEIVTTKLNKQIKDIFNNLNYAMQQPILDLNWIKNNQLSNSQIQIHKCFKCSNNSNKHMIELECNHFYHKTCFCEHIISSQNQVNIWCLCKQKINELDMLQLAKTQSIIIQEMKHIQQLCLLIKSPDKFSFFKCELNSCAFIIGSKQENPSGIQSYCQSCLEYRQFYKQEQNLK